LAVGTVLTRAAFTGDGDSDPLTLQVIGSDLVRGVGYNLLGMQNSFLDQAPNHMIGYAYQLGGFRHCQPLAAFLR
jgi:hypothetical protein